MRTTTRATRPCHRMPPAWNDAPVGRARLLDLVTRYGLRMLAAYAASLTSLIRSLALSSGGGRTPTFLPVGRPSP